MYSITILTSKSRAFLLLKKWLFEGLLRFLEIGGIVSESVWKLAPIKQESADDSFQNHGSVKKTYLQNDPGRSKDILEPLPPLRRCWCRFFLFSSFHLAIVQGNAELQTSDFKKENGKGHKHKNQLGKEGPPATGWFKSRVSLFEVLPIRRRQTGRLCSNIDEITIPLAGIAFVMLSDSKKSYEGEGFE